MIIYCSIFSEITVNVVGSLTNIRSQLAVRVQQQLHHCDAVGTDGVAQRGDALVVLPVVQIGTR